MADQKIPEVSKRKETRTITDYWEWVKKQAEESKEKLRAGMQELIVPKAEPVKATPFSQRPKVPGGEAVDVASELTKTEDKPNLPNWYDELNKK